MMRSVNRNYYSEHTVQQSCDSIFCMFWICSCLDSSVQQSYNMADTPQNQLRKCDYISLSH